MIHYHEHSIGKVEAYIEYCLYGSGCSEIKLSAIGIDNKDAKNKLKKCLDELKLTINETLEPLF